MKPTAGEGKASAPLFLRLLAASTGRERRWSPLVPPRSTCALHAGKHAHGGEAARRCTRNCSLLLCACRVPRLAASIQTRLHTRSHTVTHARITRGEGLGQGKDDRCDGSARSVVSRSRDDIQISARALQQRNFCLQGRLFLERALQLCHPPLVSSHLGQQFCAALRRACSKTVTASSCYACRVPLDKGDY